MDQAGPSRVLSTRMSEARGPRIPLIASPFDPEELALRFEAGFPLEFCACESFDPDLVLGLVGSGFIPMATEVAGARDILLPKLHLERCLLDPALVHVGRGARKGSGGRTLAVDSAFPEVVAACVATHGDGWLRPSLVEAFLTLHARGGKAGTRLLSFELYEGDHLVAGEFGALVGGCYTSWSGFRRADGSGSVQLVALARALERARVSIWDLGMPLDYKLALGGACVPRPVFLARFREARGSPVTPDFAFLPRGARELVDRLPARPDAV